MKHIKPINEGFFKKEGTGDSMVDFLDSVQKQAEAFVGKVREQAAKENNKHSDKKKYNDKARKDFEKMYLDKAAKVIAEAANKLKVK